MEERLGTIDERFAALLSVGERQAENLNRMDRNLDRLSDNVRELVTSSRDQRQSIQLLASMVGEMVKAIVV